MKRNEKYRKDKIRKRSRGKKRRKLMRRKEKKRRKKNRKKRKETRRKKKRRKEKKREEKRRTFPHSSFLGFPRYALLLLSIIILFFLFYYLRHLLHFLFHISFSLWFHCFIILHSHFNSINFILFCLLMIQTFSSYILFTTATSPLLLHSFCRSLPDNSRSFHLSLVSYRQFYFSLSTLI